MVGGSLQGVNAVLNLGGFIEPAQDGLAYRQIGVETGVDLQVQLDPQNRFQWTGELAAAYFFSPRSEPAARDHRASPGRRRRTSTFRWSASFGFLAGDDRYGVLFGIEPKLRLFEVARA